MEKTAERGVCVCVVCASVWKSGVKDEAVTSPEKVCHVACLERLNGVNWLDDFFSRSIIMRIVKMITGHQVN